MLVISNYYNPTLILKNSLPREGDTGLAQSFIRPPMSVTRPVSSDDRPETSGPRGHRTQPTKFTCCVKFRWISDNFLVYDLRSCVKVCRSENSSQTQGDSYYGDCDDMVADIKPLFTSRQETRNRILNYKPLVAVWPRRGNEFEDITLVSSWG